MIRQYTVNLPNPQPHSALRSPLLPYPSVALSISLRSLPLRLRRNNKMKRERKRDDMSRGFLVLHNPSLPSSTLRGSSRHIPFSAVPLSSDAIRLARSLFLRHVTHFVVTHVRSFFLSVQPFSSCVVGHSSCFLVPHSLRYATLVPRRVREVRNPVEIGVGAGRMRLRNPKLYEKP